MDFGIGLAWGSLFFYMRIKYNGNVIENKFVREIS